MIIKRYLLILLFGSLTVLGCSNSGDSSGNMSSTKNPGATSVKPGDGKEGKAIHITKADFLNLVMDYEKNPDKWVYKGDKPCLIDFYADWCGPCKIASPILEDLAKEYKDEIYIYKVDTEVERELSSVFGIQSIPAFLFCPSEGKPMMSNGIAQTPEQTKKMFTQMIDEILLGKTGEGTL